MHPPLFFNIFAHNGKAIAWAVFRGGWRTRTSVRSNSDVWSQNFKCRFNFGTLYKEKFKTLNLGFWSILFNNIFENVESLPK